MFVKCERRALDSLGTSRRLNGFPCVQIEGAAMRSLFRAALSFTSLGALPRLVAVKLRSPHARRLSTLSRVPVWVLK